MDLGLGPPSLKDSRVEIDLGLRPPELGGGGKAPWAQHVAKSAD